MNYLLFMFLIVLIALILMFVLPMAHGEEIELGGTGTDLPDIPISAVFSRQSIEKFSNKPYHIDLTTNKEYNPLMQDRNIKFNDIVSSGEFSQWGLNPNDKLLDVAKKLPLNDLFYVKRSRDGITNLGTGELYNFPTNFNRQLTKV